MHGVVPTQVREGRTGKNCKACGVPYRLVPGRGGPASDGGAALWWSPSEAVAAAEAAADSLTRALLVVCVAGPPKLLALLAAAKVKRSAAAEEGQRLGRTALAATAGQQASAFDEQQQQHHSIGGVIGGVGVGGGGGGGGVGHAWPLFSGLGVDGDGVAAEVAVRWPPSLPLQGEVSDECAARQWDTEFGGKGHGVAGARGGRGGGDGGDSNGGRGGGRRWSPTKQASMAPPRSDDAGWGHGNGRSMPPPAAAPLSTLPLQPTPAPAQRRQQWQQQFLPPQRSPHSGSLLDRTAASVVKARAQTVEEVADRAAVALRSTVPLRLNTAPPARGSAATHAKPMQPPLQPPSAAIAGASSDKRRQQQHEHEHEEEEEEQQQQELSGREWRRLMAQGMLVAATAARAAATFAQALTAKRLAVEAQEWADNGAGVFEVRDLLVPHDFTLSSL